MEIGSCIKFVGFLFFLGGCIKFVGFFLVGQYIVGWACAVYISESECNLFHKLCYSAYGLIFSLSRRVIGKRYIYMGSCSQASLSCCGARAAE